MKIFIHVGSGKAASTTLQSYFLEHPEVFSMISLWQRQLLSDKNKDFKALVYSDETLATHAVRDFIGCKFHASGFFERTSKNASSLAHLFPDAEILFVKRKISKDTLHSNYATAVAAGYAESFDTFITNQQIIDWTNMDKNIEIWQSYFKTVHVLQYEKLKSDPKEFYFLLNSILGISTKATNKQITKKLNTRMGKIELNILLWCNKVANSFITKRSVYRMYLKLINFVVVRK